MANPYLSGRIPVELNKQIEQYLAQSGESKTEMIINSVSAYIGVKLPDTKRNNEKRLENLELEVAELKGAVKSLYDKLNNHIEMEKCVNPVVTSKNVLGENNNKKSENKLENNNKHINSENDFINIETSRVSTLTGLDVTRIRNLRSSFQAKLKKENRILPEKQILEVPEKIITEIKIKVENIPYELFYAGQSKEGKTLWNLIRKNNGNKQLNWLETTDNG